MKFRITTHYSVDDPECYGDYAQMELEYFDNNSKNWVEVLSLSDYYHDKSDIVIDGFLQGVRWAMSDVQGGIEVEEVNVADYD